MFLLMIKLPPPTYSMLNMSILVQLSLTNKSELKYRSSLSPKRRWANYAMISILK